MKKDLTEMVFILDRSGSMYGLEKDTVGGFNSMIEKQKNTRGEALVTTILFNSDQEIIHDRVKLDEISPMKLEDYSAYGSTALLDTVGMAVEHIMKIHKYIRDEDIPEHTMFVITTDGMENSSSRYSYAKVRKLIEAQKKHNWEFIFLGANIDAAAEAEKFGIDADMSADYHADSKGTALNFAVISEAVSDIRAKGFVKSDWKDKIDKDYKSRK